MTVYRFIDAERAHWSVRLLCRVLGVSRSTWQAWACGAPRRRQGEDARLLLHIRAIHRRSLGTYGSPRVHAELVAEGHKVGLNRVARLMAKEGLEGTPAKRRFRVTTTDSDHELAVAENLLDRNFSADTPNAAWVGDITYLPTEAGFAYLAVLIDLFSRKVVGWAVADHMETSLCLEALDKAVALRQPGAGLVHHTDRGSQYASRAYQARLADIDARASMSRKANCWDNAVAESFFGTLEQELVGRLDRPWTNAADVRKALHRYIHAFYNSVRRHSTIGHMSPVDFEAEHRQQDRAAA